VRTRGDGAYYDCVNKEVAALRAHPSPDRSGLTLAQNRAIEDRCKYLRRSGVAAYNDCVAAAMARPATAASETPPRSPTHAPGT